MKLSLSVIIIIILIIAAGVFLWRGCSLKCSMKEGYKRSCLGNDCYGLQRTPVDYAFKYPNGWQRNPHWQANPADEHQPLDYGPVDLWADGRRLEKHNGVLFQQYRDDWQGCGKNLVYLTNDEKNRFDLRNLGDVGASSELDDMWNPRFGKYGIAYTEQLMNEVNPYFDKIYGGRSYLINSKLGS
jgi:hypothetical protein